MNVIDHLRHAKSSPISFEIIPPERGGNIQDLLSIVEELVRYQPSFIDVTSHAAELVSATTDSGVIAKPLRKRPGTVGLCALLQHKYHLDAVPHVLCNGFTREETEDFLLELSYLGIDNVLALRGDVKYQKSILSPRTSNLYAADLVRQITALNRGDFLSTSQKGFATNFCIGVAGYPEKHVEAQDLTSDIFYLKEKIDAGASYVVTQMFFDNQHYFSFVEQCRAVGITVPIIPGLKVLTSQKQLESLPRSFGVAIPDDLRREVMAVEPQYCTSVGVEWTAQQINDLRLRGAPGTHLYVMQNVKPIHAVLEKVL